jgi:chromosome segregation ATPase
LEESTNIWDLRSALSRERERIVEEAAREVSERDELLARSHKTLDELRSENLRLVERIDDLASSESALQRQLEEKNKTLEMTQQEVARQQADMEALREKLERNMSSAQDDFRLRLRQAQHDLELKEEEMRAVEGKFREWALLQIREAQIREREVLESKMGAEREKDLIVSRGLVQRARQEERQSADKEIKLLREEIEALNKQLGRERHEGQESKRKGEVEMDATLRTVQELEALLEDDAKRLREADEEVQKFLVCVYFCLLICVNAIALTNESDEEVQKFLRRALDAEECLRTSEADVQHLRYDLKLAMHAAEGARKDAKNEALKLEAALIAQHNERERANAQEEEREAEREKDRIVSRGLVQRARQEERQSADKEIARFRDEIEQLTQQNQQLGRERQELQESKRKGELEMERVLLRECTDRDEIANLRRQLEKLQLQQASAKLSAAAKEDSTRAWPAAEEAASVLKRELAACQQQLAAAEVAQRKAEEHAGAMQKAADAETRRCSSASLSACVSYVLNEALKAANDSQESTSSALGRAFTTRAATGREGERG